MSVIYAAGVVVISLLLLSASACGLFAFDMWHSSICGHLFDAHELQKKTNKVTPRTKQLNALKAEIHKLKDAQQELQKNHAILRAQAQLNLLKQTTMPAAMAQPSIAVPV